jgi:predicted O-methyltransferase YrrM
MTNKNTIEPYIIEKHQAVKKFYRSKICQLLEAGTYDNMRCNTSLLLVYYLIQLLDCQNILEIGFYEGQTFGAMVEASRQGNLTAVDINLNRTIYDQHYHGTHLTKNKNINLIEIDIDDFVPPAGTQYDFINVDAGDDRYKNITRAANWVKKDNGVLMVDNFDTHNDQVVRFLESVSDHGFVPFLTDEQAMYFHHNSVDHSELLDIALESLFSAHFDTSNVLYHGFVVKGIVDIEKPMFLNRHARICSAYCRIHGI